MITSAVRTTTCFTLFALALLVWATGCNSNGSGAGSVGAGGAAGSAGNGGSGGNGSGCAPTAGAGGAVDMNNCPTAYVLPHYQGDTCGLCDPGASMLCSSVCDWAMPYPDPECTPDGTVCTNYSRFCAAGVGKECGWTGQPACPALLQAAIASGGITCTRDSDCGTGHCSLRVYNRMFCDDAPPVYAKDYCPDAGADSGTDASDAGSDAADAGSDAADAGP